MKRLAGLLIFIVAIGYLLVTQVQTVISDSEFAWGGTKPIMAFGYKFADKPRCVSHLFVVTNCTVTYSQLGKDDAKQSMSFGFFGRTPEGQILLVRSPKSGAISTTAQISLFNDRLFYLLVLAAMVLSALVLAAISLVRRTSGDDEEHEIALPQQAQPVHAAVHQPVVARGRRVEFGRRGA